MHTAWRAIAALSLPKGKFCIARRSIRVKTTSGVSFPEVLVEEARDLLERLAALGRAWIAVVLRVRLAFVDLEQRLDAGLAQLAVHAHRVAEEQVAGAG